VLSDYLVGRHRRLSEDLFTERAKMYRLATRTSLLSGFITGTTLAMAYLFVAARGLATRGGARGLGGPEDVACGRAHCGLRPAATSSRATSASSKGWVTPAIVWPVS